MHQDPDIPITFYFFSFVLGLVMGAVRFLSAVRRSKKFCWICLSVDLLLSASISVIMFILLARVFHFGPEVAAALGGVCAHGGTRSFFLVEQLIFRRVEQVLGVKKCEDDNSPPDDVT